MHNIKFCQIGGELEKIIKEFKVNKYVSVQS